MRLRMRRAAAAPPGATCRAFTALEFPMQPFVRGALALTLAVAGSTALAQTTVQDGWVRGTVPQQKATGAFARITSATGGKLVGASSPVAGVVEIHEMTMDGSVMKMRAVPALDLPAGRTVELRPGGYHVMLMDLKQPLQAGDTVPLTLVVESAGGKRETLALKLPVRALGAAAADPHGGHTKP
jgi:periplasmic copper chaperone A